MRYGCCVPQSRSESRHGTGSLEQEDRVFSPRLGIKEDKDAFVLRVELPGVAREDVKVEYDNHYLRIHGERRTDLELGNPDLRDYSESPVGPFSRTIQLTGKVKRDGVKASLADGILTVTLEKADAGEVRQVGIG